MDQYFPFQLSFRRLALSLFACASLCACAGGGGPIGNSPGGGSGFGPVQQTGVAAPEPQVVDGEQVANVEVNLNPSLDGKTTQLSGKIVGSKGLPFQENYEGRVLRIVEMTERHFVDLKVQAGNVFSASFPVLAGVQSPAAPGPNGWCFFEMTAANPSQPDGMVRACPAAGMDCFPTEEMITWLDLGTDANPFNECALPAP